MEKQDSNIQIINYGDTEIQTIEINGSYWFVAKHVMLALGLQPESASQTVEKLDDDEKLLASIYNGGQNRNTWLVNESGLFEITLTSNKPDAKKFKRWITHEVLPQLYRTGIFRTINSNNYIEENKELMLKRNELADKIYENKRVMKELRKEQKTLESKVTEIIFGRNSPHRIN